MYVSPRGHDIFGQDSRTYTSINLILQIHTVHAQNTRILLLYKLRNAKLQLSCITFITVKHQIQTILSGSTVHVLNVI